MADGLTVVTVLKYTKESLKALQGITYLYDPAWYPSQDSDNKNTLPFAFFNISSYSEDQTNEISTQRVILYSSEPVSKEEIASGNAVGVVNTIADNIVVKPKKYSMKCLVPYGVVTDAYNRMVNVGNVIAVANEDSEALQAFSLLGSAKAAAMKILSPLFRLIPLITVNGESLISAGGALSSLLTINDYNKASLLRMAQNRSVLKFKSWDGWDDRYVTIEKVSFQKMNNEDNYYRCTLELSELPLLQVKNYEESSGISASAPVLNSYASIGNQLKNIVLSMEGKNLIEG